ncbi:hypothetical protein CgunFtcFv8_000125 [Champsocephalus gunnari]|uniref:Uncharacterized protein n=1 Tax=Champsocephalus gunnari TaxID=52237 RepID=A0AAN8DH59_CHAGU|nr:hypothetical protein CgunFtcFv8_000125 [Champsocephalus gunnari]
MLPSNAHLPRGSFSAARSWPVAFQAGEGRGGSPLYWGGKGRVVLGGNGWGVVRLQRPALLSHTKSAPRLTQHKVNPHPTTLSRNESCPAVFESSHPSAVLKPACLLNDKVLMVDLKEIQLDEDFPKQSMSCMDIRCDASQASPQLDDVAHT